MNLSQSILLVLLQGATEFLPVSSSGQLVLGEKYFHIPKIIKQLLPEVPVQFYLAAFLVTSIGGFFIDILLNLVRRQRLAFFAYYRHVLAKLVLFAMSDRNAHKEKQHAVT